MGGCQQLAEPPDVAVVHKQHVDVDGHRGADGRLE